jgi:hypothetical protein
MCHLIYTIIYDVIIHSIINSYTIIVYNVISHTHTHTHTHTYTIIIHIWIPILYLPLVIGRSFFVQNVQLFQKKQVWQPHFEYFRTSESVIIYIIYNSCLGICTYYGLLCCLANNSISRTMLIILNALTSFMFCVCVCVCVFLFHQTSCISCHHVSCFLITFFL